MQRDRPEHQREKGDNLNITQMDKLTAKNLNRTPFMKRIGFVTEKEYRVIVESLESQPPAYPIHIGLGWIA